MDFWPVQVLQWPLVYRHRMVQISNKQPLTESWEENFIDLYNNVVFGHIWTVGYILNTAPTVCCGTAANVPGCETQLYMCI